MSIARDKRGGAPVGFITELDGIEAASVIYLRLWCDGPEAKATVWNDFESSLGADRGRRALKAFEDLCSLCTILAELQIGQDDTLIRNIAKAHSWFEQMKSGVSFAEIADAEQTSKRRVQQMIELAFLAPDIVRDVLEGKQPIGFTSDWCKQHSLPTDWADQRSLLETL